MGDIEECQGCIAEDEADDIVENSEKKRIIKTGYATGGSVPKVEFLQQPNNGNKLTSNRTQSSHLTYCHKWFALVRGQPL